MSYCLQVDIVCDRYVTLFWFSVIWCWWSLDMCVGKPCRVIVCKLILYVVDMRHDVIQIRCKLVVLKHQCASRGDIMVGRYYVWLICNAALQRYSEIWWYSNPDVYIDVMSDIMCDWYVIWHYTDFRVIDNRNGIIEIIFFLSLDSCITLAKALLKSLW